MHKKLVYESISKYQSIDMKFNTRIKNIKNVQSNY